MSYRIGFKNGRVMSTVGNQPQQDRYRSANRRPEVGRSRFFAGVPGRPARTAPAVRPLPFHTPGSQSYKYDDGMDRGVRVRIGNYMVDMRVGAQVGEPITAAVIAASATVSKWEAITNVFKSFGTTLKNAFKRILGQGSQAERDRVAKINKFFLEGSPTANVQIDTQMTTLKQAMTAAGYDLAMHAAGLNTYGSPGNWLLAFGNLWGVYYDFMMKARAAAQYAGASSELRCEGIDGVIDAYNSVPVYTASMKAEMSNGTTDPITWSRYRQSGDKFYVIQWNKATKKFDEVEVSAAERNRRAEIFRTGAEPAIPPITPPATPITPPATPITVTIPANQPTLRKGSTGEDVKKLQVILLSLGYATGTADGIFGANTETAVKKFQTAYGLDDDGIVGANTWAKIAAVLGGNTATVTPDPGTGTVTVVTPGGGTTTVPSGGEGGGGGAGVKTGEIPLLQRPLFWGLAIGVLALAGGAGYLATRKQ